MPTALGSSWVPLSRMTERVTRLAAWFRRLRCNSARPSYDQGDKWSNAKPTSNENQLAEIIDLQCTPTEARNPFLTHLRQDSSATIDLSLVCDRTGERKGGAQSSEKENVSEKWSMATNEGTHQPPTRTPPWSPVVASCGATAVGCPQTRAMAGSDQPLPSVSSLDVWFATSEDYLHDLEPSSLNVGIEQSIHSCLSDLGVHGDEENG